MAETKIEWTDETWNPIVGCTIVSPGCTNCYAMRMAARIEKMNRTGGSNSNYVNHYDGTTMATKAGPVWTGKIGMASEKTLRAPLGWKKPKMVFVNSMGDLFHESIPDESILAVLDIIRRTSWYGGSNIGKITGSGQHTYQVLTKRAARMASFMPRLRFNPNSGLDDVGLYLADDGRPSIVMKNLWLGVSTERQQEADDRIPLLLETPAAVRFISAEPLLGQVDLHRWMLGWGGGEIAHCENCGHGHGFTRCPNTGGIAKTAWRRGVECTEFRRKLSWGGLDWVIAGGESGPHARPMEKVWAESLRDQCQAAGVSFFMKQMSKKAPIPPDLQIREFPR